MSLINKYKTLPGLIISLSLVILTSLSCGQKCHAGEPSQALINAIISVESSGNNMAVGDKHLKDKAYGPMQIRKPCVDDVNRRLGTTYKAEQCLGNRELSVKIFRCYMAIYATKSRLGHEPTDEDYSRIWNGGPSGWKNLKTEKYWSKVRQHLAPAKKEVKPNLKMIKLPT
jgi:Destabilase